MCKTESALPHNIYYFPINICIKRAYNLISKRIYLRNILKPYIKWLIGYIAYDYIVIIMDE